MYALSVSEFAASANLSGSMRSANSTSTIRKHRSERTFSNYLELLGLLMRSSLLQYSQSMTTARVSGSHPGTSMRMIWWNG